MELKRKCLVICVLMVVLSCLPVSCRATPTPQGVIPPTSVVRMPVGPISFGAGMGQSQGGGQGERMGAYIP